MTRAMESMSDVVVGEPEDALDAVRRRRMQKTFAATMIASLGLGEFFTGEVVKNRR